MIDDDVGLRRVYVRCDVCVLCVCVCVSVCVLCVSCVTECVAS